MPLSEYRLITAVFLRVLGAIYLVAFLSFWSQADGLIGSGGILPVQAHLDALRERFDSRALLLAPTVLWLDASDAAIQALCVAGVALSGILMLGLLPRLTPVLLFLCYLSLSTAGQVFTQFQWDIFLLEVGFLAIFLGRSPIPIWLFRWLLFRFMFLSGVVKLASGDRTWRDLSALEYHFETQPLPTPLAWYVHHLPDGMLQAATAVMFLVELLVPFLVFAPGPFRLIAAACIAGLETLILLTGNYNFFNLLTVALCLFLLDDRVIRRVVPARLPQLLAGRIGHSRRVLPAAASTSGLEVVPEGVWDARSPEEAATRTASGATLPADARADLGSAAVLDSVVTTPDEPPRPGTGPERFARGVIDGTRAALSRYALPGLAAAIVSVGLIQMVGAFTRGTVRPLEGLQTAIAPFRVVNPYGVFAVMTTRRDEIVLEGSADGETWLEYEFPYKPGDVGRPPPWVQPHQPRLDWQMWFAALGNYQQNPWMLRVAQRLLEDSPEVESLFARNPFADEPPRFIRARLYTYRFTTYEQRDRTGAWWVRTFRREYLPPVSLTR